ncbi:hypothetical protein [Aquimarina sp. AU119]|uniref:hypothetical protein n=1 Tax=Aquimarina sp. AU119 TaxID=2108528 RepID=UPI001359AE47|nr:hypothetical protein [Aquimarina sp. AU119]
MSSLFQYRPLFSVQLLIDYYLTEEAGLYQNTPENLMEDVLENQVNAYNIERDLYIEPIDTTKKLLKDNRLIFKRNSRGFFVSGQVSPLGSDLFTPFIPLDEPFSLQFAVYIQNPYFYNFTNVRLEDNLENKDQFIYYFSNRVNNVVNNETLYLSSPVSDFNDSYAYEASEIFIDADALPNPIMLEAIENNGPGAFNADNWREIFEDVNPLFQFVTNTDRIVSRPSIFKINVENVVEEILIFFINDHNGNLAKRIRYNTPDTGTPLIECELNLRMLDSGCYHIEVQDAIGNPLPELSLTFFMDDNIYQQRPFAIIECFHEPDGSLGEYRWLDQNNQNRLLSPEYTIRWKNRATWWRYYYETAPDLTSSVLENLDPNVNSPNNRILISTSPLALTQIGREIPVILGNGDSQLFPNPDIQMIYPENGRIYSELNMGGGLGPPE